MSLIQIVILAMVQGAAELLPVSSSAHVIAVEKLMGIDPSTPEMTFFLVMLHTGTMFAAIVYFGKRWRNQLSGQYIKVLVIASAATASLGFGLKKTLEHLLSSGMTVTAVPENAGRIVHANEVEDLFRVLPLIALALACAGALILISSRYEKKATSPEITTKRALWIGLVQGLCLPFRGFSRSGATISAAMITGLERRIAEEFSFALAVILTPAAILHSLHRVYKATGTLHPDSLQPGIIGMVFAFVAGLGALKWLSSWLENGKWRYFGYYCLVAAGVLLLMAGLGY